MREKERMSELIARLNEASNVYYNGGQAIMTDHEWDAGFDELAALEAKTGVVLPGSPTNKAGQKQKVQKKPMSTRRCP